MAARSKPVAPPVAAPESPVDPPVAKHKTGPKLAKLDDLTEFAASLDKLTPAERKAYRTKAAETTLDLFMSRLTTMLASDTCRAQTLLVAANFLRMNNFEISPDTSAVIDPLEKLMLQKKQQEKDAQIRLRNMEREKAKRIAAEEARAASFYQRVDNPTEPTKRLNTGLPGTIGTTKEEETFSHE